MNKKQIADLIEEAEHQQEGFHRVSGKMSQDLINALKEQLILSGVVGQSEQLSDEPSIKFERKSKILEAGAYMHPNIKL
jgi:hypothetical protein